MPLADQERVDAHHCGSCKAGRSSAARGRGPTLIVAVVGTPGEVLAAALTNPTEIGLPFGAWTLDRLAAYLNEEKSIPIRRSRIDDLLIAEGLRWRQQEKLVR